VSARRIEKDARSDNVGVNEILRRIDAAIDVRFGREIDHGIKLVIGHERVHLIGVGDVALEKFVTLAVLLHHAVEVREIPRVSQSIDICYVRRLVMLQNVTNKVAPDEATAAGNKNAHASAN
jgi:hypothetical protein